MPNFTTDGIEALSRTGNDCLGAEENARIQPLFGWHIRLKHNEADLMSTLLVHSRREFEKQGIYGPKDYQIIYHRSNGGAEGCWIDLGFKSDAIGNQFFEIYGSTVKEIISGERTKITEGEVKELFDRALTGTMVNTTDAEVDKPGIERAR